VSVAFYHFRLGPQFPLSRSDFLLTFFRWSPLALLYALPFAFCGLILGALLSAPRLPTRRIYCFDLLGSALGAVAVIPAISRLGVETSLLLAGAILPTGAALLARPRHKASMGTVAVAGLALGVVALVRTDAFHMAYPRGSVLASVEREDSGEAVEFTAWDPLARIELSRVRPPSPENAVLPSLIGSNRAFHSRFRRMLTQNNFAYTYALDYDGQRGTLTGIEETIYAAAYQVGGASAPRVLVVGVGGGFDVLTALYFQAASVTGAEINGATVGILTRSHRDYFRPWVADPRVRLVHAEGRHFLATEPGAFDVIQLSGVDSYSGTPGAAHVFSENYLYTAEAFDLYLSRLTPQGILNMMRLEQSPPREMLRALTTAVAALRRAGVEQPARHVVTITDKTGHFTALLVKKSPFTEPELARIEAWATANPFQVVSASPSRNERKANAYQAFLSLGDSRKEAAFIRLYPFDISPTEDDWPFFFRHSSWGHLLDERPEVRSSIPVMEYSVVLLLGIVGVAALVCVYLPLRFLSRDGLRVPQAWRLVVYFAGLGVGYMAVEIALLQKFGHFLGHPNYALSVVLAALLLATGVGSLSAAVIVRAARSVRFVAYALAVVVLAEYTLVFPRLPDWIGLPFALRALVVFALVAPIGVCLGVFFPSALDELKERAAPFVPWAWGINGIFSVMAPVASVAWSITWGIGALLLSALPVYLLVGWSLPVSARPPRHP
jgi:spermidine synthase